jgi:hypothetical protein
MVNLIKTLSLVLVLLMLTGAYIFDVQVGASSVWKIQTISNSVFSPSDIVVDSNDYPHIAYTNWTMGNPHHRTDWSPRDGLDCVIYLSWNGTTWINQTAVTDAAFEDLALDSFNNVHILCETYSGGLTYASWTGYSWQLQIIDKEGFGSSLALDSWGNPHVAYLTNGNATSHFFLKYSSWTGSSWNTQIIDAPSEGMTYSASLKLDALNQPHIMYNTLTISYHSYNSSEVIKYATFHDHSGWTIQTVDQNIELGNMVLDSNGFPHFLSQDSYFSWTGSDWKNQPVLLDLNSTAILENGYCTLDKQNYPQIDYCISYEGTDASTLTFERWTGTQWDIQTAGQNFPEYAGPIAVDSKGNPHILYYTGVPGGAYPPLVSLMYTTTTLPPQTTEPTQISISPLLMDFLIAIPVTTVLVLVIAVSILLFRRHQKTQTT